MTSASDKKLREYKRHLTAAKDLMKDLIASDYKARKIAYTEEELDRMAWYLIAIKCTEATL